PALAERSNGNFEFESRGVAEWKQTPEGLEVVTLVRVRAPDGEYDALIPVIGVENKDTQGREWYIPRQFVGLKRDTYSNFGAHMARAETEADNFLVEWVRDKLYPTRRNEMFLDTLEIPYEARRQKSAEYQVRSVLAPAMTGIA